MAIDYDNIVPEKIRNIKPSGIRKFFDVAQTIEDVISLGVGEPDFATPWSIRKTAITTLERGKTTYTANSGLMELRSEISKYIKRKNNVEYHPENEIVVTVGGSEAIDAAIRSIVAPGDEVLIVEPCFVCYSPIVTLAGGIPVSIDTKLENDFKLKPEELKSNEKKCREALFADKTVEKAGCKFLFVPGGETRQKSVYEALMKIKDEISDENPVVFIHDGARPFVTTETISLVNRAAKEFGAAAPGLRPVDTQKEIDDNGFIKRHLERSHLISIQTPQAFKFHQILEAHKNADSVSKEYTDDTELWDEFISKQKGESRVKIVIGDPENKKITYQNDLSLLKN